MDRDINLTVSKKLFREGLEAAITPVVLKSFATEDKARATRGKPPKPIAQHNNGMPITARQVGRKVGRNQPCPCGSGKKHKKCCAGSRSPASYKGE